MAKKRERRTRDAHATPARGRTERHLADAPLRGRGTSTATVRDTRALSDSGWRILRKAVLVAHATIGLWIRSLFDHGT
jgi:hypothetical protein